MLKVVLDTNIYISFLCKPDGVCGNLFKEKFLKKYNVYISDYILKEIYTVAHRDNFR